MPASSTKQKKAEFAATFARLRKILAPFSKRVRVTADTSTAYMTDSLTLTYKGKPMFFAGVRLGKSYISYYLMPVYCFPELLKEASPDLKKRMQGKSCFYFTSADDPAIAELGPLTKAGFDRFAQGKLPI